MDGLNICLGCLTTGVQMFELETKELSLPYQQLTGFQLYDYMPHKLCWECAALVKKFNAFRLKCERAHTLLQDTYMMHGQIIETTINEIDRQVHNLLSHLEISRPFEKIDISRKVFDEFVNEIGTANDIPCINFNKPETEVVRSDEPDIQCDITLVKIEHMPIKCEKQYDTADHDFNAVDNNDENGEVDDTDDGNNNADDNNDADDENIYDEIVHSKGKKNSKRIREKSESNKKSINKKILETQQLMTKEEATEVYNKKKMAVRFMKSKYKCELCYRTFNNESQCSKHKIKHSEAAGDQECDICKLRFKTKMKTDLHYLDWHANKYTCAVCKNVFHNKSSAGDHSEAKCRKLQKKKRLEKEKLIVARRRDYTSALNFNATEESLTQEQMKQFIEDRQKTDNYKSSPFKCALCYKGFLENKTYMNHLLLHDPVSGPYECDICKQRYLSRNKLRKHITGSHLKKYTCLLCNETIHHRSSAKAHHEWHKGVQYTCHICGTTARKLSSHLSHMRIKHPSDYICTICSLPFVSLNGLARHKRMMHSIKSETIQINSMESVDKEGGHYCPSCEINFDSRQALTRHILISPKHGPVPGLENACRECGEVFDSSGSLRAHRKSTHLDKLNAGTGKWKPRDCALCGERFEEWQKYFSHLKSEHPNRPKKKYDHHCKECPRKFHCKALLNEHMNKHLGVRPFSCDVCGKSFYTSLSLRSHHVSHSDERPFKCEVCGMGFKFKSAMKRHQTVHTGAKPYTCTVCNRGFTTMHWTQLHIRKVHNNERIPYKPRIRRPKSKKKEGPSSTHGQ